ncbi:MAG TPA: ATP-binding protein [Bryobacteraceae bacterium]|nr:ATP-binding protein [Bryobacteraceae bacterium]
MTARIFIKLILAVVCVLGVALTAVDYLVTQRVQEAQIEARRLELEQKARTIALTNALAGQSFVKLGQTAGARVSWIATDGRVLADSDAIAAQMENRRGRPEVDAALAGRVGSSLRVSDTLGARFLYVAVPLSGYPAGDGVLRLAVPAAEIDARVAAILRQVMLSTAFAFLPAVVLAAVFARIASWRLGRIIDYARQLAEGNFRARLRGTGRGELGVLSSKLNETAEKLEFVMVRLETEHAELEKLERVRKDFVANVSHELRTPLASIQGYTETLLDGAIHDSENNLKFLNIIRQNAERLRGLTSDLLVLSQVEQGKQKFRFAPYSVSRLLTADIEMMRPIAQNKSIELVQEPTPEEVEVFCDARAVHQILTNLLDNAIKYTPDGGRVTAGARLTERNMVEVFIRDTGLGIPDQELPRLFERFYRVDKARSRAMGGTGLGLAIVKHLTRAQGGDVRVESQAGRGSTFFFTLPTENLGLAVVDFEDEPAEVPAP